MFDFRVSHEEESANKKSNASEDFNLDEDLYRTEGIWTDITLRIGDNDRLFYIYTLTGIILSTIIITLARSFIFFSASISLYSVHVHINNWNLDWNTFATVNKTFHWNLYFFVCIIAARNESIT